MTGRPELTASEQEEMLRKLEPYLKSGLSVNKACREAKVPKSTVFDYIAKDDLFSERIKANQQYLSVLTSSAIVAQLHEIIKKQQPGEDKDGKPIKGEKLNNDDINFLKWFALNSNLTREEFGERKDIGLFDAEAEVRRLMELIDSGTSPKTPSEEAKDKEKKE